MRLPAVLGALLAVAAGEEQDDHAGHDHGGTKEYEWAAVFELEHEASYAWVASKAATDDGAMAYADATMKIVVMQAAGGSETAIEAVADDAEALMEGSCAQLAVGGTIGTNFCYKLVFAEGLYESIWEIAVPAYEAVDWNLRRRLAGAGYYAVFAEHYPDEFVADDEGHYLRDASGSDVEPLAVAGGGAAGDDDDDGNLARAWRNSMLATLIVLVCTWVGLLGRLPFRGADGLRTATVIAFASSLAVGALLGCAAFLMFVEGSHLIAGRWRTETQATWRFGAAMLGGYALGLVLNIAFPHGAHAAVAADVAPGDKGRPAERAPPDYAFCFNIFMGDFWHNLVDGIFIANAFLDCDSGWGWTVAGATIYHELVQEFADFFLLVGPGGLSVLMACVVNFFSGVSVMVGAAVYLWTEPGMGTQGLMLAFSGGVYTYVACTEAAAHVVDGASKFSAAQRLGLFAFFAVGCAGIGLVLLDHEHCSSSDDDGADGDDPHAGHNH